MQHVQHILSDRFASAITQVVAGQDAPVDPQIRPSADAKFGDYQANFAMSLAKRLGQKPRDLAQKVVDRVDLKDVCEKVELAGPGFVNLHLRREFLERQLAGMAGDAGHLGVPQARDPQTVVVDYSGPNVAKEMHVGHLRSTVIGDAVARVLAFQGHRVVRQNHLGDWGTQFGMLILHLKQQGGDTGQSLDEMYRQAKQRFDADPDFAEEARRCVVELQGGQAWARQWWQKLVDQSRTRFQQVYQRLDVLLTDQDYRGESFYNPMLPGVVEGLEKAGLLRESQGAKVVFPAGFSDRENNPQAMIVRKSDGGYLYATTDLAAARYRVDQLHAGRIVYVTDARQSQHFAMVFATLRQAGWAPGKVRLDHVPFGTVLGKEGKPFKTREGGTVKLIDLIDEAQRRAAAIVAQKNPQLPADEQTKIAHAIGIGALKYADLSNDRIKDYVFDWDRMLSFDGNTAPYLQNAYVRIRSIFRKGNIQPEESAQQTVAVGEPAERALAVKLLQLPAVVESVAESLEPHRLCTYLYELASSFHRFYEDCPVLSATDRATRDSRLALCSLVGRVLEKGLGLLGIRVIEQM